MNNPPERSRELAPAIAEWLVDHRIPAERIALCLLPVARQILEERKEQLVEAEKCLASLENEPTQELDDFDTPDGTMGGALCNLKTCLDEPQNEIAPLDLVNSLLVAANGDPADWHWNREIATALLRCHGNSEE